MSIKIESTSAATCRANGLVVGSQLASSTQHGDVCIEITHIGTYEIRAKTLSDNLRGPSESVGFELFSWRNWSAIA
ncbi:hypothetical protein E3T46_07840 [Cryobacterium sp. Hh11]|uniref:DUF7241 domain-containing protein n=1 Tax=Cryobacterium sp. Hh11 TaxID=2555868 RepID=UPI001069FAA7|nr:hypothetical protein [Cryobacterium sp. Hh11]TFD51991.1 hypothetical protein E3T46_07840 [Cryobacterium sp. Hh11]